MPRHQRGLHGDAKELARELAAQNPPNPTVIQRINRQFDAITRKILEAAMSAEEALARGLYINDFGKIALMATNVEIEQTSPYTERLPKTPADVAVVLNQTRKEPKPHVDARVQVFPVGYDKPVHPTVAGRAFGRLVTATDRIGLLLRTPSIQSAEISHVTHIGTEEPVTGVSSIPAKHADNVMETVAAVSSNRGRTTWEPLVVGGDATFSLHHIPLETDPATSTTVLVRRQLLGAARESNGVLGVFGGDQTAYRSPGREIRLVGSTTFSIAPEYVTELTGGIDLQIGEPFDVDSTLAADLDEYIDAGVIDVLAPAYTSIVAEQELLAA